MRESMDKTYDVALSFAGEDRPYVSQVAEYLGKRGINVFYDTYFDVDLWGKDLIENLDTIYRKDSRLVVMFISKAYASKEWTTFERRSALAGALKSASEYVLPVRFDDTDLPGLPPTVAYKDARSVSAEILGEMTIRKLGRFDLIDRPMLLRDGVVAWRFARALHAPDLGAGTRVFGGAWSGPGTPIVYCSSSYCAAFMEVFMHGPSLKGAEMVGMKLLIPPKISIRTLYEDSLPKGWREHSSMEARQKIGSEWASAGLDCILSVPSRLMPYERVLLLNPCHPEFKSIRIGSPEPVYVDDRLERIRANSTSEDYLGGTFHLAEDLLGAAEGDCCNQHFSFHVVPPQIPDSC